MHVLLLILLLLLLLSALLSFRVLALFFIDQIVHCHHRLFAVATMLCRILLLILALELLRSHGLIDSTAGLLGSNAAGIVVVVVVPGWRILL